MQQIKRKPMAASAAAAAVVILKTLIVVNLSSSAASAHQLRPQVQPAPLADPLVWDPQSLYAAAARSQRVRRSAPSAKAAAEEQLVDACQSRMEVLTPYHATNSKGKLRTVVNTELMQQAVQVETCIRAQAGAKSKCNSQPDCGCEQKYKWHRLLVLDPKDSAGKGLFMDWFLFPSSCVCRCRVQRLLAPAGSQPQTPVRPNARAGS